MPGLEGRLLKGRYRITQFLGGGGMAEVYKAYDQLREHDVAVKLIRDEYGEDPIFLRRFEREAEALRRLQHRHIVRFYGFEREGILAFLVMDSIEGDSLRRRLAQPEWKLSPDEALEYLRPVCSALDYAHAEGILHRDVKPANVLIDNDGQVYL